MSKDSAQKSHSADCWKGRHTETGCGVQGTETVRRDLGWGHVNDMLHQCLLNEGKKEFMSELTIEQINR